MRSTQDECPVGALVEKAHRARWRLEGDGGELSLPERNRLLADVQDAFAELVDLEEAGQPDAARAVEYVAAWL